MKAYLWVLALVVAAVLLFFGFPHITTATPEEVKNPRYIVDTEIAPNITQADVWSAGDMSPSTLIKELATKPGTEPIGSVDSQKCYEMDYSAQAARTGSYTQRTNNYKHSYPDSCTGLRQEMVGTFYA